MKHKVKVTVLDKMLYPELQRLYCENPANIMKGWHAMHKFHTRFLSLLLALVMSCSMMTAAFAAENASFSDVKTTAWYYNDVTECAKLGIVAGFEDGTFRPDEKVSSVQFITMLARTFYNDKVEEAKKSKPAGTPWYWANLKAAEDVGMSKGLKAVDDNAMDRYEMAAVLNNVIDGQSVILMVSAVSYRKYINGEIEAPLEGMWASEKAKAAQQSIRDWDSVPSQYQDAVSMCYALGALSGMSDGTFSGTQSMTRAQACVVITRMKDLTEGRLPAWSSTPTQPQQPTQPEPPQQTTTGKLANGQDATVENVQAILDQIKREYPEGTVWSASNLIDDAHNNFYAAGTHAGDSTNDVGKGIKYGHVSLKYGCGGWAAMVSDRIFGQTGAPCREVTDPAKVRPSDILVRMNPDGGIWHVGIILQYVPAGVWTDNGMSAYNDQFITCDGNLGARSGEVGTVTWYLPNSLYDSASGYGSGILGDNWHVLTRYPD